MPAEQEAGMEPAELVALATQADRLVEAMAEAESKMRGGDAVARSLGHRVDEAAEKTRAAARSLVAAAHDLARIRSHYVPGRLRCGAEWGCCPEHGNTLVSSGGRSWCKAPGCGRSWDWDRGDLPCTEPAVFRIRGRGDAPGKWGLACDGHALGARQQLVDAEVVPIDGAQGDLPDAG